MTAKSLVVQGGCVGEELLLAHVRVELRPRVPQRFLVLLVGRVALAWCADDADVVVVDRARCRLDEHRGLVGAARVDAEAAQAVLAGVEGDVHRVAGVDVQPCRTLRVPEGIDHLVRRRSEVGLLDLTGVQRPRLVGVRPAGRGGGLAVAVPVAGGGETVDEAQFRRVNSLHVPVELVAVGGGGQAGLDARAREGGGGLQGEDARVPVPAGECGRLLPGGVRTGPETQGVGSCREDRAARSSCGEGELAVGRHGDGVAGEPDDGGTFSDSPAGEEETVGRPGGCTGVPWAVDGRNAMVRAVARRQPNSREKMRTTHVLLRGTGESWGCRATALFFSARSGRCSCAKRHLSTGATPPGETLSQSFV